MAATVDLTPDELLTTTRVVRKRLDLDRPVDPALIEECVEIALQAPSGGNAQRWHWLVITDPDQRAAIGAYYRKSLENYAPGQAAAVAGLPDEKAATQARVADSTAWLGERMGQVPVLVLPCIQLATPELPEGNQAWLWGSLLPAAWSYMLAARSRGLGTAWTTLHFAYEKEIGELLGLPSDVRQGCLIPTAYYTGDTFKPAKRTPVEEVVHRDRW